MFHNEDITLYIASYLDAPCLISLCQTCSNLHTLLNEHDGLFFNLLHGSFPGYFRYNRMTIGSCNKRKSFYKNKIKNWFKKDFIWKTQGTSSIPGRFLHRSVTLSNGESIFFGGEKNNGEYCHDVWHASYSELSGKVILKEVKIHASGDLLAAPGFYGSIVPEITNK